MGSGRRVAWGKLIHVFIRAGWQPPSPSNLQAQAMIDDMVSMGERAGLSFTAGMGGFDSTLELTGRELTSIALMAEGMTMEDAAQALDVSRETFKSNLKRARDRIGAKNTAHAVAICFRQGLLP